MTNKKYKPHGAIHWTMIVAVVVTTIVAAVGYRTLVATHAATSSILSPTLTSPLIVTNANNNQTVNLKLGQTLQVNLSNIYWPKSNVPTGKTETSTSWWFNFSSSNPKVLNPPYVGVIDQDSGSYQKIDNTSLIYVKGLSTHAYVALNYGTSTINAVSETSFVCGSGISCPLLVKKNTFTITVDVSGCVISAGVSCPL